MKRQLLSMIALTVSVAVLAILPGCSQNVVQDTQSAPATVLSRTALGKVTDAAELAYVDSVEATETEGGSIALGDDMIGTSTLGIPADAVDDPSVKVKMMKMKVNSIGEVSAELGPDGLHFKRPVMVVLSYKGADLTGIDETTLRLFYVNEETQALELIPESVPDTQKKTVTAPLWHFSRYVIGGNG